MQHHSSPALAFCQGLEADSDPLVAACRKGIDIPKQLAMSGKTQLPLPEHALGHQQRRPFPSKGRADSCSLQGQSPKGAQRTINLGSDGPIVG